MRALKLCYLVLYLHRVLILQYFICKYPYYVVLYMSRTVCARGLTGLAAGGVEAISREM